MSSRARIYTVHVRAWSAAADREAVFLREGFSWGAFIFSFLWALWHRLWFAAVILLGVTAALAVIGELLEIDPVTDAATGLAWALIIGWHGNDFRRRALERAGYVSAGVVAAPNLVEAERRFFAKSLPVTPAPIRGAVGGPKAGDLAQRAGVQGYGRDGGPWMPHGAAPPRSAGGRVGLARV